MVGTHIKVLLNSTLQPFDSLTVDYESRRIYFVYIMAGEIYYYDIENEKIVSLLILGEKNQINTVTVYNENIYYSDNSDHTIRKCSKNDCHNPEIIRNDTS